MSLRAVGYRAELGPGGQGLLDRVFELTLALQTDKTVHNLPESRPMKKVSGMAGTPP